MKCARCGGTGKYLELEYDQYGWLKYIGTTCLVCFGLGTIPDIEPEEKKVTTDFDFGYRHWMRTYNGFSDVDIWAATPKGNHIARVQAVTYGVVPENEDYEVPPEICIKPGTGQLIFMPIEKNDRQLDSGERFKIYLAAFNSYSECKVATLEGCELLDHMECGKAIRFKFDKQSQWERKSVDRES